MKMIVLILLFCNAAKLIADEAETKDIEGQYIACINTAFDAFRDAMKEYKQDIQLPEHIISYTPLEENFLFISFWNTQWLERTKISYQKYGPTPMQIPVYAHRGFLVNAANCEIKEQGFQFSINKYNEQKDSND